MRKVKKRRNPRTMLQSNGEKTSEIDELHNLHLGVRRIIIALCFLGMS